MLACAAAGCPAPQQEGEPMMITIGAIAAK